MDAIEAIARVAQSDPAQALELALGLWSTRRAPGLARVVCHLTEVVERPQPGVVDDFQATWMALAEAGPDAVRTGWLADQLRSRLPHDPERL